MLRVGLELGDRARVLPACRRLLDDSVSHIRKAHSYLIILAFVFTPLGFFILPILFVFVIPKFEEILRDMF